MTPYRITAVCLGNICRSPMAESVLRAKFARAGFDGRVVVDSAGTAGWHEGSAADPRTQRVLRAAGYSPVHRARQFRREWFGEVDLVLAMDRENQADLLALAPQEVWERIRLFRSFDPLADSLEVPDPYYGGLEGFEQVLAMVEAAADGVVAHVRQVLAKRP